VGAPDKWESGDRFAQAVFYAFSFFTSDGFAIPALEQVSPEGDLRKPFGDPQTIMTTPRETLS